MLTRAVLPGMRRRGFGRIVNMGSIHSLVASPYKSAYVAAKHGLIGFAKTVALETADYRHHHQHGVPELRAHAAGGRTDRGAGAGARPARAAGHRRDHAQADAEARLRHASRNSAASSSSWRATWRATSPGSGSRWTAGGRRSEQRSGSAGGERSMRKRYGDAGLRRAAWCAIAALRSAGDGGLRPQRSARRRRSRAAAGAADRPGRGHGVRHLGGRLHGGAVPRRALGAGAAAPASSPRGPYLLRRGLDAPRARPLHEGRRAKSRPTRLLERTSQLALDGAIDPIAGLADDRVWIFHGAAGSVRAQAGRRCARGLLPRARRTRSSVARVEHAGCRPHLPDREFHGAGLRRDRVAVRRQLRARRGARAARSPVRRARRRAAPAPDGLVEFDQRPYARAVGQRRAWRTAAGCTCRAACAPGAGGRCRLHVVFHGCKQGASFVGDAFMPRARLPRGRRGQPHRAAVPAGRAELPAAQSERLLGLVGLRGRGLCDAQRAAGAGGAGDDRRPARRGAATRRV